MHPTARLFQPRVKNDLYFIMTLDASDELPLLVWNTVLQLLHFHIKKPPLMTSRFLCRAGLFDPTFFKEFGLERSGENPFLPYFKVR